MKRRRNPSYELFYGSGGHGGPYRGMRTAYKRAKALLKGRRAERSIRIVNRSTDRTVTTVHKDRYTGEIRAERARRNPRRRRRTWRPRSLTAVIRRGWASHGVKADYMRKIKRGHRKYRLAELRRRKAASRRNPYYQTSRGVLYHTEPASRSVQRLLGWRRLTKRELQQMQLPRLRKYSRRR